MVAPGSGILRAIFLPWLPQTGATVTERNAAIALLLERQPSIGWNFLLALWLEGHSVGTYHYQPQLAR